MTLSEMQKLVGGDIEFIEIELGVELCVNEYAIDLGLPRNARYPQVFGDVIVGRSLWMPKTDTIVFAGIL